VVNTRKVAGVVTLVVFLALVTVAIVASGDAGRSNDPRRIGAATFHETGAPAEVLAPETSAVPLAPPPCVTSQGTDPYFLLCGPMFVKAGDVAAFDLVARGAGVRDDCASPQVDWGDGEFRALCFTGCGPGTAEGVRAIQRRIEHIYRTPGTYTARFNLVSCTPEYGAHASITFELHVEG
jgi:hypothetical protein